MNVWHHGEADELAPRAWLTDFSGVVRESGVEISIVNEEGDNVADLPFGLEKVNPVLVNIGAWRGQHSGDDTCLMRYDVARAYLRPRTR